MVEDLRAVSEVVEERLLNRPQVLRMLSRIAAELDALSARLARGSTGEGASSSSTKSPSELSSSSPIGVSSETGSLTILSARWTLSSGISRCPAISSRVGSRPSRWTSKRVTRNTLLVELNDELVWRKSRRDRRFAVPRCWSEGDSNPRSHPTKSRVCRRLGTDLFAPQTPTRQISSLTIRGRERSGNGGNFGIPQGAENQKGTDSSNPLRSTNESQRTAGRCRSNREHQRRSPAGRGWPIPPRPTERTPIRRPSHGLRDAANNSAAESRLTNDSPRLRKRARRLRSKPRHK